MNHIDDEKNCVTQKSRQTDCSNGGCPPPFVALVINDDNHDADNVHHHHHEITWLRQKYMRYASLAIQISAKITSQNKTLKRENKSSFSSISIKALLRFFVLNQIHFRLTTDSLALQYSSCLLLFVENSISLRYQSVVFSWIPMWFLLDIVVNSLGYQCDIF